MCFLSSAPDLESDDVRNLITGPDVFICEKCVADSWSLQASSPSCKRQLEAFAKLYRQPLSFFLP
jgi:hypothetical protein